MLQSSNRNPFSAEQSAQRPKVRCGDLFQNHQPNQNMTRLTTRLDIHSETGDCKTNNAVTLEMDGSQPDCPISFIIDGKPVFSLGADEVSQFAESLESLVP